MELERVYGTGEILAHCFWQMKRSYEGETTLLISREVKHFYLSFHTSGIVELTGNYTYLGQILPEVYISVGPTTVRAALKSQPAPPWKMWPPCWAWSFHLTPQTIRPVIATTAADIKHNAGRSATSKLQGQWPWISLCPAAHPLSAWPGAGGLVTCSGAHQRLAQFTKLQQPSIHTMYAKFSHAIIACWLAQILPVCYLSG